jgi:AcrR family transcriptional regulator
MTSETTTDGAQRGRPRSQQAHRAILAAAGELLLARGLSAVSMDAVAERAGVSKATIYRWWPTKETLALDALYTEWAAVRPSPRDTGSLRGDLLSLVRPWAKLAASRPYGRVVAALLAEANSDPVFAGEYRHRVLEPRREQARAIVGRAIERGEIARSALRRAVPPTAARPRTPERQIRPRRRRHGTQRHPIHPDRSVRKHASPGRSM